jgi:hypothetical protein
MDLGVAAIILVAVWIGVFVVVLAMCKMAARGDDQLYGRTERATRPDRVRPRLHGLRLNRG